MAQQIDEAADRKTLERLKALGFDDDGNDVSDTNKGKGTPPAPAPSNASSESQRIEELVRHEVAKVTNDKQRDDRIGALEKKVERPPEKRSWISRKMWEDVRA